MGRGLLALLVVVLALLLGSPVTDAAPSARDVQHAAPFEVSSAAATQLAGWYPIYHIAGPASRIAVDSARGRILVAAWFQGVAYNSSSWLQSDNLLVLDFSGNLLHNISLTHTLGSYIEDFAIDPLTGYAYVSFQNGTVLRVDPGAGQVARSWTYWKRLSAIAAENGVVFVSTCCDTGTIMRIDSNTGVVLRNYTPEGQGGAMAIAIAPLAGGSWSQ